MSIVGLITFLLVLGILVFAHELGHFLVARWTKVSVLKFSLGFGPKVYGFKRGETEYLLSAIPLGGYVKLLGDDPEQELSEEEKKFAFLSQPGWKKAAIVFAGPLFNLILAYLIFTVVYLIGVPQLLPKVGAVEKDSPAALAGMKEGDLILSISGEKIVYWDDIRMEVQLTEGKETPVRVQRDGQEIDLVLKPKANEVETIFKEVRKIWLVGIMPEGSTVIQKFNPFMSLYLGLNKTGEMIYITILGIVKMIQGILPSDSIGGPILIAQLATKTAEQGVLSVLMFIAILSINLGIINLFPIPILDGGHLLFFAIEGILGRELGARQKEIAQQIGLALLVLLMVYAFKNDFVRLFKEMS